MSKALSMIKKYCSDDLFDDEEEEENEYTKENNQEYSSFFSNPQIQTSVNLFTKLKKGFLYYKVKCNIKKGSKKENSNED